MNDPLTAAIPLDTEGATFAVTCYPATAERAGLRTLLDHRADPTWNASTEAPVQLLEETEYQYRFDVESDLAFLEPSNIFQANDKTMLTGVIRTGRATGTVRVVAETVDGHRHTAEFEVRSRKLNYRTDYRSMLNRIATEGTELVQAVFGPSVFTGFHPDAGTSTSTLYQRFSLIESIVLSDEFAAALQVVRVRPHVEGRSSEHQIDPVRGVRPGSGVVRSMAGPGPRQPAANLQWATSVPLVVDESTTYDTLDTVPNRFVRYAVDQWLYLIELLGSALDANFPPRAFRAIAEVQAILREAKLVPALAEAGPLTRFPAGSTVLTNRAGYRDLYRSFLISQIAAAMSWDGGEDVFGAGLRDVATLYEYWVFLELARVVEDLPGFSMDRSELVHRTRDGAALDLKSGNHVAVRGLGYRRGEQVKVSLHFNRSFVHGARSGQSWTRRLRPDCSIHIEPARPRGAVRETWIHFDAKYRLNRSFGQEDPCDVDAMEEVGDAKNDDSAKNDDLMKMHAYRDALRRTSGAYVLYPGETDSTKPFEKFHEVLPGLGAFALRPAADGRADPHSSEGLRDFIADVIDHAAADGTSRGRSQFWEDRSYANTAETTRLSPSSLAERPAADTKVLLGFVKNEDHLRWITKNGLYNLRAEGDGRNGELGFGADHLSCDAILLYTAFGAQTWTYELTGALRIQSKEQMLATGYPSPGSSNYLCLELGPAHDGSFGGDGARALAATDGFPTVISWLALANTANGSGEHSD